MLTSDQTTFSAPIAVPVVLLPKEGAAKTVAQPKHLLPLPATRIWGVDYSVVKMHQALDYIDHLVLRRKPTTVVTSNLNYAMLCETNPRLAAFTEKCPLVLCDGMPILWRSWLNKVKLPERIAGADLIFSLAERSAARGHRIFLMGGADGIAAKTAQRLKDLYPGIKIVGAECPPFRQLDENEHEELLSRIRAARPDILLIAFGQPKGEFWIEDNAASIGVPVSIQLGASFDFVVGNSIRAPKWIQKIGMEWLFRTYHDPKRLVPRYAKNCWFLLKMLRRELLDATA